MASIRVLVIVWKRREPRRTSWPRWVGATHRCVIIVIDIVTLSIILLPPLRWTLLLLPLSIAQTLTSSSHQKPAACANVSYWVIWTISTLACCRTLLHLYQVKVRRTSGPAWTQCTLFLLCRCRAVSSVARTLFRALSRWTGRCITITYPTRYVGRIFSGRIKSYRKFPSTK